MTSISYYQCDRCGVRDDHQAGIWHYPVQDINGANVAHLCGNCLKECAPNSIHVKAQS